MHVDLSLRKRHIALFLGSLLALVVLAATPQLLGDRVAAGIDGLSDASAVWIWIAAAAFAGSLAAALALGSLSGALPRWPIAVLLLGVLAAAAVAWRARSTRPGSRWAHALDVFRVLGRCPRAAAQLAGWVGLG